MSAKTHTSDAIDVHFNARRCIHARKCVLGLPKVFQPDAGADWIQPANAGVDDLVKVVEACPSGALTYTRKDGAAEKAPEVNTIRVWESGPLEVKATLQIPGEEAQTRALLCRCGLTRTPPYCNGLHKGRFEASGEIEAQDGETLEARDGPLEVTPFEDGPLGVKGNVELISGSGARIKQATETYLCRCGKSKTKPYCDGSHKDAGFKMRGA